jgi:hypothetical protein
MEYVAYLRAEAARFRKRAKREDQPDAAEEFSEFAAVCDRVANEVEDRLPAGEGAAFVPSSRGGSSASRCRPGSTARHGR